MFADTLQLLNDDNINDNGSNRSNEGTMVPYGGRAIRGGLDTWRIPARGITSARSRAAKRGAAGRIIYSNSES